MCRERRAWQGETKQRTPVRKEEQRSQDRRARCNRVHSAVTYKVKMNEDRKVNIHATLEMFTSGQLLFLGLICTTRSVRLDAVFLDDLGPGVDLLVSKDPRGCQTGA